MRSAFSAASAAPSRYARASASRPVSVAWSAMRRRSATASSSVRSAVQSALSTASAWCGDRARLAVGVPDVTARPASRRSPAPTWTARPTPPRRRNASATSSPTPRRPVTICGRGIARKMGCSPATPLGVALFRWLESDRAADKKRTGKQTTVRRAPTTRSSPSAPAARREFFEPDEAARRGRSRTGARGSGRRASARRPAASRRSRSSSRALPPTPGLAIVLVQHLAPQHESALPALLARVRQLPVVQATRACASSRTTST